MFVTNPFIVGSWTREDIESVSSGWRVLLVGGVISVVAAGIILFTDWTVGALAVFVGALLVVRGVFTMMSVPVDGSGRGWSAVLGLVEVGVGVAVWAWPGPTLLVVALFIGWYVLFAGIMTIAGAISGRGVLPYWGLALAVGIVEVVLSFWLLSRPGLTLVAAVFAIGLWCLIYGVAEVVLAFEVKNMGGRADEAALDIGSESSPRRFDATMR